MDDEAGHPIDGSRIGIVAVDWDGWDIYSLYPMPKFPVLTSASATATGGLQRTTTASVWCMPLRSGRVRRGVTPPALSKLFT